MASTNYLSQFNMVLSVSDTAINNQLLHLYNQPVKGPLPVPGKSAPPTEYLIKHAVNMAVPSQPGGLTGNIACPTISWTNLSQHANADRTVKMTIKFLDNSSFSYWAYDPSVDPPFAQALLDIEGYTMSFEASLGISNIESIEEGLLHPNVATQVVKYINSEDYLVSSLFCLFESAQIASSFMVSDASGAPVTDQLGSWVNYVNVYFTSLNGKTPDKNPFILGYGVTQNPKIVVAPPEFAPKKFEFSTTGVGVPTLNFLLLTDDRDVDVAKDPTAGIFTESFFNTINSDTHDGVLAMCSKMMMDQFLIPQIAQNFWYGAPPIDGHVITVDSDNTTSFVENYHRALTWHTDSPKYSANLYERRDSFSGSSNLTIIYTSDDQVSPASVGPADAQRRMYIDLAGTLVVKYLQETTTLPVGTTGWDYAFTATITTGYKVRLIVSCGAEGNWIVEQDTDPNYTVLPKVDGNKRIVLTHGQNYDYRAYGIFKLTDFLGLNSVLGLTANIGQTADNVASYEWQQLSDSISKELTDLSTKITMPAGDVFQFDGLNTDVAGNVYSSITYQTLSDGSNTLSNGLGATGAQQSNGVSSAAAAAAAKDAQKAVEYAQEVLQALEKQLAELQATTKMITRGGFPSPVLVNTQKMVRASVDSAENALHQAQAAAAAAAAVR